MYLDVIAEMKEKRVKDKLKGNENLKEALLKSGISIIGEFKKASPSKGEIVKDFNLLKILEFYEKRNISAFSILTEEDFFKGRDEYIEIIKKRTDKPILRKDFIIDEFQIYETKFLGADCILLIVALLKERLLRFYNIARNIGLEVLVEVHSKEELEKALEIDAEIIGINNRDLKSFKVDIEKTGELIKFIPKGKIVISESGVSRIEDINYLEQLGVHGVLVGEFYMRSFLDENKNMRY